MPHHRRALLGLLLPLSSVACFIVAGFADVPAKALDEHESAVTKRPFMQPVAPARSNVDAWFNLRVPGPETNPVSGPFDTERSDLPPRPASFGPGPTDPLLSGAVIFRDLVNIVEFSHESRRAGDYLWGRIPGRAAYDKTVEWVTRQLRLAGLSDAHIQTFPSGDVHLPGAGELRLIGSKEMGAGSSDLILQSAMVGGNGPVDGQVTAPLMYVGQGVDADLQDRSLSGKIAVLLSTPSPSLYSTTPARRIQQVMASGAVGLIEILVQPGNLKSFDRDRHGCGRGLCFTVGGEDGYFLQNLLGAAGKARKTVTASLTAKSETINRPISNVVATIPGKTEQTVIIDAHADGWFGGADDNGTGLAIMVALARYFQRQPQLERTLVFVASAGHHSSSFNGTAAFRTQGGKDYLASADLILNIEHPSQSEMMRSYLYHQSDNFGSKMVVATGDVPKQVAISNRAPFLMELWRQGVECFGLDVQRVVDQQLPGELNPLADMKDVPRTQMIASGAVYHTTGDDLHSVPPAALERAARFHAYFISKVANAPVELLRGGKWASAHGCPATP